MVGPARYDYGYDHVWKESQLNHIRLRLIWVYDWIRLFTNINKCKLFINVMSSWNINNNQLILEGLIRAMSQLTERKQLL